MKMLPCSAIILTITIIILITIKLGGDICRVFCLKSNVLLCLSFNQDVPQFAIN